MNIKINWKKCLFAGIIFSLILQIIFWIGSFQLNRDIEPEGVLVAIVSFPPDLLSVIVTLVIGFAVGFILALLANLIIVLVKNNSN